MSSSIDACLIGLLPRGTDLRFFLRSAKTAIYAASNASALLQITQTTICPEDGDRIELIDGEVPIVQTADAASVLRTFLVLFSLQLILAFIPTA